MKGRRFSEFPPTTIGVIAAVAIATALAALLNVGKVVAVISGTEYVGHFAEASGLKAGDPVRISGVRVGAVESVELERSHVRVVFSTDQELGDETRLGVKSDTLLGSKSLDVRSAGRDHLREGAVIPLSRTTSAYDLTTALADLTSTTGGIDTSQLAKSLDTLSAAFENTPDDVRTVLNGTERLARTVAARDDDLNDLLDSAESVSAVLARRNTDIITIISDGNALLATLQRRREELGRLFEGLTDLSRQLSGLVRDNRTTIGPSLAAVRRSLKVIDANLGNIDHTMAGFSQFARSLQEGLGSGTFFQGYLAGIASVDSTPVIQDLLGGSVVPSGAVGKP